MVTVRQSCESHSERRNACRPTLEDMRPCVLDLNIVSRILAQLSAEMSSCFNHLDRAVNTISPKVDALAMEVSEINVALQKGR